MKEAFEKWKKEHLSMIKSVTVGSPRGDYYCYARLYDGKIYAVGQIEGNYAGGDTASILFGGREALIREIARLKTSEEAGAEDLFYRIKDIEVISTEEYMSIGSVDENCL